MVGDVDPVPLAVGRLPMERVTGYGPEDREVVGLVSERVGLDSGILGPVNVIVINLDDTGLAEWSLYDDFNSWPGNYPYASMPFVASRAAEGIRFTNARFPARCLPSRGCNLTGRQPHVTDVHPYGQGMGYNQQDGLLNGESMVGTTAEFNPWPKVAREMIPGLRTLHVGKLHAEAWTKTGAVTNSTNPGQLVDEVGFERAYRTTQGANRPEKDPWRGYVAYTEQEVVEVPGSEATVTNTSPAGMDATTLAQADPTHFLPRREWDRITGWIDGIMKEDPAQQFVVNWWGHLPHASSPAMDPAGLALDMPTTVPLSPANSLWRGTMSQSDCVPYESEDADGSLYAAGDGLADPAYYDEDGNAWVRGPGTGFKYSSLGKVNTTWRRVVQSLEAVDVLVDALDTWLKNNHPEAHKRTVFILHGDNGYFGGGVVPKKESDASSGGGPGSGARYAALGAEYTNVLPPTTTGAETSDYAEMYHRPDRGKSYLFEGGTAIPMVIWGAPLPPEARNQDCDAVIEATDFYPTILDLLAGPGAWREHLGATEAAKVDGISFYPQLLQPASSLRQYALAQLYLPILETEENHTLRERIIVSRTGWKLYRRYEQGVVDEWRLHYLPEDRLELDANNRYADAVAGTDTEAAAALAELQPIYLQRIGNLL